MSADKFDNELSSLYQQRKQQTTVPSVDLTGEAKAIKVSRSPFNILALLLTGGVASFGILAVVTHFAKPPVHGENYQYKQHSVRVVEMIEVPEEVVLAPVIPPLPPKPKSLAPKNVDPSSHNPTALAIVTPDFSLNKALKQAVKVPKVSPVDVAILPIHKVMPEYPISAIYAREAGRVKLQYRISNEGKVVDIESLSPHKSRLLERSAKQALAKWRYPAEASSDKALEIEFEFNLRQD